MVALLLDTGVSPNLQSEDGRTALHSASEFGSFVSLQLLITAGGVVGTADKQGNTALHEAAKSGFADCVKLLIQSGADPSAKNAKGETPRDLAKTEEVKKELE